MVNVKIQITTQQMIQVVGSRKRSPLSTGMSADFQSVSAPDADGISAVETDSRSGRQSAEHKRILPLSFLGTDGIIIS